MHCFNSHFLYIVVYCISSYLLCLLLCVWCVHFKLLHCNVLIGQRDVCIDYMPVIISVYVLNCVFVVDLMLFVTSVNTVV